MDTLSDQGEPRTERLHPAVEGKVPNLPSDQSASAVKITVEYADGLVGRFERQPDDTWHQTGFAGLRITGYDAPNVLRVLSNGVTGRRAFDEKGNR